MNPVGKIARIPGTPRAVDVAASAALLIWALLEALLGSGPGPQWARIGFAVAVTVPLVVRRRFPLAVICLIAVLTVIRALTAAVPESGTFPFPSMLLAAFSVALYAREAWRAILGGLIGVGALVVAIESTFYTGSVGASNLAILGLFMGGAWAAGRLVRRRSSQAMLVVADSTELARSAVAEERSRIARELHDVIAHSVSIIAVQAGAAEQVLDGDPAAAREHLGAVRRTAREALSELRRVLEVLRDEDADYAPQAGLSRLSDLLEENRRAGLEAVVVEEGEPRQLPGGIDLVAFRIVQESLTNVRKHANAAPTRVALRYGTRELELEISNQPAPESRPESRAGPGHGLIGMRERARLFGGSFDARRLESGGFRVHAVLPYEEFS